MTVQVLVRRGGEIVLETPVRGGISELELELTGSNNYVNALTKPDGKTPFYSSIHSAGVAIQSRELPHAHLFLVDGRFIDEQERQRLGATRKDTVFVLKLEQRCYEFDGQRNMTNIYDR